MSKKVNVYDSQGAVAKEFADFLVAFAKERQQCTVALSGGSTPKALFQLLATDTYREEVPWENIHFFWGDERCVAPDHSESNFKMTKDFLFDEVPVPEGNIHRILGENEPAEEAVRYGQEINEVCADRNNLPQFDLVILGMGDDGHTASIFPHQMELLKDENICAVAEHPESGQNRVTLTGPVINNASTIAFLVTGAKKAEKVAAIFNQTEGHEAYPASHIAGENLYWFLDEDAHASVN